MTVGQIVTGVYDLTDAVDGVDQTDIVRWVDRGHKMLHRYLLIPDAISSTETFTWAVADGSTKDVSGSLTRWRAKVHWISGTNESDEWAERPLLEMKRRQIDGDSYYKGNFTFAVQGGTNMLIAATPGAAITVSVQHFQYPDDLNDLSDTPVMPTEFHEMLVDYALHRLYLSASARTNVRAEKNSMETESAAALQRFRDSYKELVTTVETTYGATLTMAADPLARMGMRAISGRRDYW